MRSLIRRAVAPRLSVTTTSGFLEVLVDTARVALPLHAIDRVLRAAWVEEVPGAGGCLRGALDVAGEIVPVYDLRRLVLESDRPLRASDRMVLTRSPTRCALLVDDVLGTRATESVQLTEEFGLHAAGLRGVARGDDGLLLVHDLQRLLALQRAIPVAAVHG